MRHRAPCLLLLALLAGPVCAQPDLAPGNQVQSTVVPGRAAALPPRPAPGKPLPPGDVTLNFAGVDVQQVTRAVLGGILGVPYAIDPSLRANITAVTERPIARSAVLPFLEGALRAANVALVETNGTYQVMSVEQARAQAPLVADANGGYGTETFTPKFVGVEQLRRLIDGILPGVVASTDPSRNVLIIAGTSGQRRSARDLVQQFDVNWLRAMSFAVYIPQQTDARLIAPELEKLINSPGSPTAGLVKLIAMERLNGILAISPQPQYLEDVRRWIEILDREGQGNEPRMFVYRVQNGRSSDLAKTLLAAFGGGAGASGAVGGGAFGLRGGSGGNGASGASGVPTPANAVTSGGDNAMPFGSPLQQNPAPAPGPVTVGSMEGGGRGGQAGASGPISATTPSGITITSDEANNAIVVFARARDYAIIEDALRKLDVPPLQVMIEAAITEVTLTKDLRYGVQWLFSQNNGSIGYTEGTGSALPTQIFPGLSGVIARQSITATLNALSQLTTVNVVSAPKLMVINNQTASLQVGDEVPVTSASALSAGTNDTLINQIEYRDTGVILKITPRVNASGLVLLDVAQEVSAVSRTTTSGIDSPTISTRKVATSVAVEDGETIALGGLITRRNEKGKNGIPILSTLPIIGALFGTHTDTDDRTELVVLLKPRVVRNVEDGRAVTDELRQKLRAIYPDATPVKMP